MALKDLIQNRRSVFPDQYNDKPVSNAVILELLEAANWAPTHKRTEPWRFKVLQGEKKAELGVFLAEKFKATAEKFSEFKYNKIQRNAKNAGAILAICMDRDVEDSIPEWEEVAATAMAVQNMWLTATDLGLGAYWSSPGLITTMHEFFSLKPNEKCLGFLYVGYYDGPVPERTPKPIEDKIEWL
ncbi:nitroreductase family protein [Formosa algae]|uniref:Putative NAD(P)H nitroreductase n=1 Tax=Formosa algae TaxID=225843 RepID=A0A9X1CDD9_9FLAO|nr:nitroreductase [Formosa algae]MBP1841129.1 nitroreductase [Formosa algae]MDQ0336451.1 nitroreductase [Formosa algae]OEI81412.1 nitroreductase [Formosa algae]PNW27946.1 nitroreductase [Formosa algae]